MKILLAAGLVLGLAANAHAADKLKPGQWEITTYSDVNGMKTQMTKPSPEQQKQMEKAGVSMPTTTPDGGVVMKSCMTKEQAARGPTPKPPDIPGHKCEQTDVKQSGNTTQWKMACTGSQPVAGSGTMTVQSPEAFSGKVTMNIKNPQAEMVFNSSISGKWLSPTCETPAGAKSK